MLLEKITVAKRRICCENRVYHLTYRLLNQNGCYGVEVVCVYGNCREEEQVYLHHNRQQVVDIIRLFAKEVVFPIALKETLENYG